MTDFLAYEAYSITNVIKKEKWIARIEKYF